MKQPRCPTCRRRVPECECLVCDVCGEYALPETCHVGPVNWDDGISPIRCEACLDARERAFELAWGDD
jgi:hypothetical protein